VNDYRAGAKVVLANRYWQDVACSVRVKVIDGQRDAGVLCWRAGVRVAGCSLGCSDSFGGRAEIVSKEWFSDELGTAFDRSFEAIQTICQNRLAQTRHKRGG
jgi:hypothetical protein